MLANPLNRASLIQQAFTKCPDTHVVVSGYSQGAMLVHNAAKSLSSDITGKITAAVTFGDPCTLLSSTKKQFYTLD
jgi:predicted esterase